MRLNIANCGWLELWLLSGYWVVVVWCFTRRWHNTRTARRYPGLACILQRWLTWPLNLYSTNHFINDAFGLRWLFVTRVWRDMFRGQAALVGLDFRSKIFAPDCEQRVSITNVFTFNTTWPKIKHFFFSCPNHTYSNSCLKDLLLISGLAT